MLKNEFKNTGELGREEENNYNDWIYSKEYMEMTNAYNFQESGKILKEAI
jgi:hypothetical protein